MVEKNPIHLLYTVSGTHKLKYCQILKILITVWIQSATDSMSEKYFRKAKTGVPGSHKKGCGKYENLLILTSDKHELTHPVCIHGGRT